MLSKEREAQLIRRAQRGDGSAVEELIRAHQGALYAFMLRLCHRADLAEDMVQEAFVRVLRNIDRFDPRFRFSTWLFTIARRLWVNHQQKLRPESEGDGVAAWASDEPRPEDLIVEAERRDHVRRIIDVAVSCLNPIQRELVTLFHDRAWTIEALSRHFSLPEGTIKSHLFRARKRMQEAITRDESLARQAEEIMK